MKLIVDCELSQEWLNPEVNNHLAFLLSKALITPHTLPLEALVCEDFGLQANPDYPIAPIAAAIDVLNADLKQTGAEDGDVCWLRADPVNLILQRDCFVLGEVIPVSVSLAEANVFIDLLNQHFAQDGLRFVIGQSGAWYVKYTNHYAHDGLIKTTLPHVVVGKNVHHFLPQGKAATQWVGFQNEIQMLLHEHPINLARELKREPVINSVWFSGGGCLSALLATSPVNQNTLIVSMNPFYQGLADCLQLSHLNLPEKPEAVLSSSAPAVRLQLPNYQSVAYINGWLAAILSALKDKTITQLTLNLGFGAQSITAKIRPLDLYKFWRKIQPVMVSFGANASDFSD